ncbi:MAG: uroporphyrinogen-III synthase [Gammaproteobacteria bacterium]|nr:uroporphyrinogen-III synthase [Gammaproteobacteria bacterium]
MNSNSLSGLTVLITRPSNQVDSLRQAIEAEGAKVLSLPLIKIKALNAAQAIQDLKDKVLQLDSYQSLIFVSNNAVNFGGEVINNYWPQFPVGVDVIAVGPTTAEAASVRLACEVIQPSSGMTSEDILCLPQLSDVSEKKVGIVRGQGGRELLADTLRQRGATVDYLEAYSRTPVDYTSANFCNRLCDAGVNVLTVSSGESLDRLTRLLADNRKRLQQLNLVVPSERVGRQAEKAGYQQVYNARGADPLSFVSALGELGINQE